MHYYAGRGLVFPHCVSAVYVDSLYKESPVIRLRVVTRVVTFGFCKYTIIYYIN